MAFRAWPRVYLLAQRFGGLRPFFSGQNFTLFSIALREGNCHFIDTFIDYIDGGLVLSQRAAVLSAQTKFAPVEKELWDQMYDYSGSDGSKKGLTLLVWRVLYLLQVVLQIRKPIPVVRRKTHSILRLAIELEDVHATHSILDAWLRLLNQRPEDSWTDRWSCSLTEHRRAGSTQTLSQGVYPLHFRLRAHQGPRRGPKNCTSTIKTGKKTDSRSSGG